MRTLLTRILSTVLSARNVSFTIQSHLLEIMSDPLFMIRYVWVNIIYLFLFAHCRLGESDV